MRDNQDYMRLHEIVQDYAVCSPPPRTARELKQNLWVGKLPSEECHGAVQHDVTDPTKPRTAMTIGERYETIHQPDGTCGQGWSRIILGSSTKKNQTEMKKIFRPISKCQAVRRLTRPRTGSMNAAEKILTLRCWMIPLLA